VEVGDELNLDKVSVSCAHRPQSSQGRFRRAFYVMVHLVHEQDARRGGVSLSTSRQAGEGRVPAGV
jgi:hypothetical protein